MALHGTVDAPGVETVRLQRRTRDGWKDEGTFPVLKGAYRSMSARAGVYRVVAGWAPGPAVRVDPPAIG